MAKNKPNAGDFTGRQLAAAKKAAEEAQAEREAEITMITAQKAQVAKEGVFDAASGEVIEDIGDAEVLVDDDDVVVDAGVQVVEADDVVIRVNETLENVTYGVGQHYNFVEGQKYKVPRELAKHLDELGYVWH